MNRGVLLRLVVFLFLSFSLNSLYAATATISSNLVSYSPGKTLTLSYTVTAGAHAGVATDIYIAGIMPDGTILLLTPGLAWTTDLIPLVKNVALSSVSAPGFLSAQLPNGLPSGIYQFFVVLVTANADPVQTANWLGSSNTTISYVATGTSIDSFIYFKRGGSTVPQAATISFTNGSGTGTLLLDGKSIPGIYYISGVAGSGCLGGGNGQVLTRCFSPSDLPNTMLLCGPDPQGGSGEVLLYVLFYDPDNNRVASNTTNYLAALQSEHNYSGGNVYRSCSGSYQNAWIRNYPATNYYKWPDVFTTYSAGYLTDLLNGAAIYSTPNASNKYYEYVIVRPEQNGLEVWH